MQSKSGKIKKILQRANNIFYQNLIKMKLLFTISFTLLMNNVLLSQGSHVGKEIYDWISEI